MDCAGNWRGWDDPRPPPPGAAGAAVGDGAAMTREETTMCEVVLMTSPEAATYRTDIAGWVSRKGHFFGVNEDAARYDGATHRECEDCGKPIPVPGFMVCEACREVRSAKRWEAMPLVDWDGATPLALHDSDRYFFSEDDVREYCDDPNEMNPDGTFPPPIPIESLHLVLCVPNYAHQIDPQDEYSDVMEEDGELPDDILEAFEALNAALKVCKEPISWTPGKSRVVLTADEGATRCEP
jgi:hypothetical protein